MSYNKMLEKVLIFVGELLITIFISHGIYGWQNKLQ